MPPAGRRQTFASRLAGLFRAGDTATEDGRVGERHRQILLGAVSAGSVRALGVLTALVTIPLTYNYLGPERFGMWVTLSSFNLLLSFTDFGIGNGIITAVAQRHGQEDQEGLGRYVSTAYLALSAITAILLVLSLISPLFVDWASVFAVTTPLAKAEAGPATVLFLALFAVGNPLNLIGRVQTGLQQQWQANLWVLGGNLGSLAAVVVAIVLEAGLVWLVLGLVGTPLVFSAINTAVFMRRRRALLPSLRKFDRDAFKRLARTGTMFMILQLCVAAVLNSNYIIITRVMGPSAVAGFAVPDRLFQIISQIGAIGIGPLWAAYGEAAARGDADWVRRTFRRSIGITLAGSFVLALVLVLSGQQLVKWWIGDDFHAPILLLVALGVWRVIETVGHAINMLLNSMDELRLQVFAAVAAAGLTILLRIWLVDTLGVVGAVYGGIIAYALITLPVTAYATLRVLRRLDKKGDVLDGKAAEAAHAQGTEPGSPARLPGSGPGPPDNGRDL